MATKETGGSAFPTNPIYSGDDEVVKAGGGMTLRDWFAGQIIAAVIAADGAQYFNRLESHAQFAYAQADAMLAERAKP